MGAVDGSGLLSAGLADKSLKAHVRWCLLQSHLSMFRAPTSVSGHGRAAMTMQLAPKMTSPCYRGISVHQTGDGRAG